MGVNVGYTWASNYFKQVFAVSAKVTNGLNADGSEILFNSTKNSKDYWFDADYWFGPDGGVTFMTYHGTKDQIQNQGAADEFTYRPTIRRYGVFGNYLFFDKLDVLGGYLRSNDDWQDEPGAPIGHYHFEWVSRRGGLLHPARLRRDGPLRPVEPEHRRRRRRPIPMPGASAARRRSRSWATWCYAPAYGHERDQDPVSGSGSSPTSCSNSMCG